jgi:hypothetical protein
MSKIKRTVAIAMFGNSYEVDYGALLPHFHYSDFTSVKVLDEIAERWMERSSDDKIVRVYECLGQRNSAVIEGWNKFFSDLFSSTTRDVSAYDLTESVIAHAAGEYERVREVITGFKYRQRSLFSKVFGEAQNMAFSEDNRIFSDLRVVIVPLQEQLDLTDEHFLAPGDKIFHLISRNLLEGTKIVEYSIRDRHVAVESWTRHTIKYTATTERSTMPLHFELRNGAISMASYGDCTSPFSSGPLFLSLDQAKRAEAAVWDNVTARLDDYRRSAELG